MGSPDLSYTFNKFSTLIFHPFMLAVIAFGCLIIALVVNKQSNRSTSVEESVRLFYYYLVRENWNMMWACLSPTLRAELLNSQRPAIVERGSTGIQQLALMVSKNPAIFSHFDPRLISKHKVPLKQEHLEMMMVHTRSAPGGRVITLWLVRSLHTQGHWFIEEMLIHPEAKEIPYTLTGKRFTNDKKTGEAEDAVSDQEEETNDQEEDEQTDESSSSSQTDEAASVKTNA
jgi:hypothetical protein